MPISIVVPQLGESVAEGTVSKWLKQVGDRVRKEEPLVEIQTDKINVEIPSPAEGTLESISVQEGTTVLVGTEIGVLSVAGETGGETRPPQPEKAAAGQPATGGAPAPAAPAQPAGPAAPAQSSAPQPAPEPAAARTTQTTPPRAPSTAPAPAYAGGDGANGGGVAVMGEAEARNLSPAVRKLMREHQVSIDELSRIRGSGIAGRVTRDDLLEYLEHRPAAPAAAPARAGAPAAAPPRESARIPGLEGAMAPSADGPREETVPFTKVRKLIAENMVKAKHTAAHTHCFDETDMSAIVALKKEWGPKLEAQGVHLTYMPFFMKASVLALKEFPWVNGEVKGDAIVVKKFYNIGVAVGREEKGLIVPNVKDVDRKSLTQLAAEVNDLAARARADRLKPDDIQGGTFSITNAGVFGAINSSPVINVPEVAILGVHKIVERPVIKDGQIVARPMMNASIGFDHRVIDGELAVKFLRRVCELLERPEMLWFYA
jgi:2-oxoglutarate dehydrogenase complex dihydrolipoamide succinyltransferase (E2) component